jgi:hypothetical protein
MAKNKKPPAKKPVPQPAKKKLPPARSAPAPAKPVANGNAA